MTEIFGRSTFITYVISESKKFDVGGIRTHASEETGALIQRLRPLGHNTIPYKSLGSLVTQKSYITHSHDLTPYSMFTMRKRDPGDGNFGTQSLGWLDSLIRACRVNWTPGPAGIDLGLSWTILKLEINYLLYQV